MSGEIKVWKFDSHYIMRISLGKHVMGWRVDQPFKEDTKFWERLDRLWQIVRKMKEREDGIYNR